MQTTDSGEPVEFIHRSPGITAIYNELKFSTRNNVLDLGSSSHSSFQFFSQLSCHIHFETLDAFLADGGEVCASAESLQAGLSEYLSTFPQDKKFDIILAWDIFNYLDGETLRWLVTRLNQHCRANTLLHTIKYVGRKLPAAPRHYQILDQYHVKISCDNLLCSRPFANIDTNKTLKSMPDYVVEQTFMRHEGMAQDITEHVLRYQSDKKNSRRQQASAELSVANRELPQHTVMHRSYGLEQICAHLRNLPAAKVLTIGSKATHSGDFFLEYAEQVYVEDLVPSLISASDAREGELHVRQHALNYAADIRFDVILAWDLFNFCSLAQLATVVEKLRPHLHDSTHIFAFFYPGKEKPERPQKCYLLDERNIALLPSPKAPTSGEDLTAVAVLKILGNFHLANTHILRPGMHGGIYEYIFTAGAGIKSRST
jgi:hypothetical protein